MPMTEIEIVNVLNTKTAFAVTCNDNRENVFIPSRVSENANLRIGQRVDAMLIVNTAQPDKTPWLASFVTAREVPRDDLLELIREDLERGPATPQQVATSINKPLDQVTRKLRTMSVNGDVVRDDVYALHADDFLMGEDD
jgi:hypothetical protein